MMRPHNGAALAAAATLLALLASCTAPSPTSTYTDDAGQSVTVDWADFPAYSGTDRELVLAGPSVEEAEARAEGLFTAIRAELDREFGTTGWRMRGDDGWYPAGGNGFGGQSMLTLYNSATWESETAIPQEQWPAVISTVERVAREWGLADPGNTAADDYPEWMRVGSFFRGVEWFDATVQDARLDEDALSEAGQSDFLVHGVSLFYGITTLHEKDREEFAGRAAPFIGLEHPDPTTSD